ncbi:KH domain-containing protein [Candidatus Saccharibacteria bacterium]|nr:KH domain-containing protein [Candidatus Saccharibacteria bacterium]
MAERDQEFLEYIVGSIVDKPEDVKIVRSVDERGVLLELTVNPEDMGKIIGKAGATAKALRTLLRVMGAKYDARFNLKITEPGGEDRQRSTEPTYAEPTNAEPAPTNEVASEPTSQQEPELEVMNTEDIKSKAREGLEDLDVDI